MRKSYSILLVLLIQACTSVPKSGVQPESVSYKRYMATQPKPKPEDSCYRYIDPHVANPGAMKFGCEDYVKKYKGKVQR